VVLLDPWWETEYMGVAVGVLVTVILILIAVILFIMYKNHVSSSQPPDHPYYETYVPKVVGHPGPGEWDDPLMRTSSPKRKLPPTPNSSEDQHYRDPSLDHSSSPLIRTSLRQQQQHLLQQHYAAGHWGGMFPPPQPLPGGRGNAGVVVVNHYAATDLMCGSKGSQHFL